MSRLMSVAMTADAVIERRKTVTRRKGWWLDKNGRRILKAGDTLTLCRKVQGRKPGEPIERLAEVVVVNVHRELLSDLTCPSPWAAPNRASREMDAEGFPGMDPARFVLDYFVDAQGMDPDDEVTRIEWRYLETHAAPPMGSGQMPCCERPVFEADPWHRLSYNADAVTCPGVRQAVSA